MILWIRVISSEFAIKFEILLASNKLIVCVVAGNDEKAIESIEHSLSMAINQVKWTKLLECLSFRSEG